MQVMRIFLLYRKTEKSDTKKINLAALGKKIVV